MKRCCLTLFFIIMVAIGQFFCNNLPLAGGSSSTDNGRILGMICLKNGLPAPETKVTLVPAGYNAYHDTVHLHRDTTDSAGAYTFRNITPGIYNIEALDIDNRTRALICGVSVDSNSFYAPVASVVSSGSIRVQFPRNASAAVCYAYLPGTSLYCLVQNGWGVIDSVPAGLIPFVYYANTADSSKNHVVKTELFVASGAATVIADYSAWKYSKRLFLNTAAAGAGIPGNVCNFPVLVRLSNANFVFSQAQSDGSDIRFKKSDDTPLSYEIERWDAVAERAEIWVKVDTVFGNESTHFFSLYWGNPTAGAESISAVVFDTADGFVSVWHLNQPTGSNAKDATGNKYDGVPSDTAPSQTTGAIGMAQDFNGSSNSFTMPGTASGNLNFPENGSYSMSVWVCADTLDSLWRAIAGKGHEQYYMQLKGFGSSRATWEFVEFQNQKGWYYTEDSVPPAPGSGTWLNLVGVRSGASQHFYINGELVIDTAKIMVGVHSRITSDNFAIGRFSRSVTIPSFQGWSYFNGKLDEVRVSRGAPSADWIKLCYMNQKENDVFVVFETP